MSWSYENSASSNKDRVRFLLGDIQEIGAMLQDEDITFALDQAGISDDTPVVIDSTGCLKVAIDFLPALIAQAARQVDYTIGPEKVWASQRLDAFKQLHTSLENQLLNNTLVCGPIRIDSDLTGHFRLDQDNYRGW